MKLSERALLVSLNLSGWSAEREDKACAAEVARAHGSDVRMGKYRRYLVDPDSLKSLKQKAGEIRTEHYRLTLPWDDNGQRVLASEGFLPYRDKLKGLMDDYGQLADDFVSRYPDLVNDARSLLNGLFNQAEYPDSYKIRRKFEAKVNFGAVPESGDFRVELTTDDSDAIKADIESRTQQAVGTAMAALAERIRTAVRHMAERLRAYEIDSEGKVRNKFHDTLVGNIQDLVDLAPSLNITGDQRITDIIAEMQAELSAWAPDELRDDESKRKETADKANEILDRMSAYGL